MVSLAATLPHCRLGGRRFKEYLPPLLVFTRGMRDMSLKTVRNIGIIAHIDAGKTTTSERMLFYSGYIRSLGDVDDGDTVLDYMKQERERGITINSAAITFHWGDHTINLIDTPGHVDFTVEVERALRVMDGAVAIFDAVKGVEAQSVTVWRQAQRYHLPTVAFVNKMDRGGASMTRTMDMIGSKLGAHPLVLHLPIGEWNSFRGFVDLIRMRRLIWADNSDGCTYSDEPLMESDGGIYDKARQARMELAENVAELDDIFLEKVEDFNDVSAKELTSSIRRVTLGLKGVPVLCGSALRNKGVQPLLDAVGLYLPSPLEANQAEGEGVSANGQMDVRALAFKVVHDRQRGMMVYLRIYQGVMKAGVPIYNNTQKTKEKPLKLLQVFADEYKEISQVGKGHIAVALGLKQTHTGDTLVSTSGDKSYYFKAMKIPTPVFFCTVEPESIRDEGALVHALQCMQREDPSFHVHTDATTGQRVLSGMGELHLEIIRDRLVRDYKLAIESGNIQVAYKETITTPSEATHELSCVFGGKRQTATLTMRLTPLNDSEVLQLNKENKSYDFVDYLSNDNPLRSIDRKKLQGIIKEGIGSALSRGSLMSFPVVNVRVVLLDGSLGPGSSNEVLSACASHTLSQALEETDSILLQPIMKLDVSIDGDKYVGKVLQDLSSQRHATIKGMDKEDSISFIKAEVPLSAMIGYSSVLRSLTAGNSSMTMEFVKYGRVTLDEKLAITKRIRGY